VTSKIHLGSISPGYIDHLDELVVSEQAVHVKGLQGGARFSLSLVLYFSQQILYLVAHNAAASDI